MSASNIDDAGLSVHKGFPNPASDQAHRGQRLALDLNQLLVQHPSSTYLFRVSGHTWAEQGVYDGDVAVVERSAQPQATDLVVAWQSTSLVIINASRLSSESRVWGVVTAIIHKYR